MLCKRNEYKVHICSRICNIDTCRDLRYNNEQAMNDGKGRASNENHRQKNGLRGSHGAAAASPPQTDQTQSVLAFADPCPVLFRHDGQRIYLPKRAHGAAGQERALLDPDEPHLLFGYGDRPAADVPQTAEHRLLQ